MRQDAASRRGRAGGRPFARARVRASCVAALLAVATFVVPGPTAAHASTPSSSPAFDALGRCLAQRHRLLLGFVMDESGSLGDASRHQAGSDPNGERVAAAQVAVQGLADLAGHGVQVQILLSGFSADFASYGGWQNLDQTTSGSIKAQLEQFRARDQGLDTDFFTAIAGVQTALAARAAATPGDPCQVVMLFTDGRFDIATSSAKPYDVNAADPDATKVAKGVAALCAPNGPMQQLRKANGETFTLALSDPSAPANDQPDRAFLSRLATGDCSTPGAQYGASYDAANAPDLVDQFDAIVSSIRGGTQRVGGCVGSAHAFDVVPALGSFHVLADVGSSPQDIVVTAPDHHAWHVSPSGAVSPKPTDLTVQTNVTSNRFVTIDASPDRSVDPTSSAWSGRWTVNFASANPSGTCQVFLFDGWKPVLRQTTLHAGSPASLIFDLVGPNGAAAHLASLAVPYSLAATITGPTPAASTTLRVARKGDSLEADYTVPKVAGRAAGDPERRVPRRRRRDRRRVGAGIHHASRRDRGARQSPGSDPGHRGAQPRRGRGNRRRGILGARHAASRR